MTTASKPRAKRLRSPRRTKTGKSNKAVSASMKTFWQDPERVALWRKKHEANMAARKADPDKRWSRRGIPDGMTREQAEIMWTKAQESAKATTARLEADTPETMEALETAIAIMRSGYTVRHRLAAARLVFKLTGEQAARPLTLQAAEQSISRLAGLSPPTPSNDEIPTNDDTDTAAA